MVGSHPHADHIGGLISVLEQMSVSHYLDAGQHVDSFTGKRLQEVVKTKGIRYHTVAAGDSLVGIGGLVLHPTSAYISNSGPAPDGVNNGSVVIRIVYWETAILLTGDIEHETDSDLMLWNHRLRSDILKAAHHGSRTSSTPEFLAGVNPSIAAISCGKNNNVPTPFTRSCAALSGNGDTNLENRSFGCNRNENRSRTHRYRAVAQNWTKIKKAIQVGPLFCSGG